MTPAEGPDADRSQRKRYSASPDRRDKRSISPRYRVKQESRDYRRSRSPDRGFNSYRPRRYSRSPPPRRFSPGRPTRGFPRERPSEEQLKTATNIFIGNLPYKLRERDIIELADRYGRVAKCNVPLDRYTGDNKGFAFIEFEDRKDAEDFFAAMSTHEIGKQRLRVDWDVGRESKTAMQQKSMDRGFDRRDDRRYDERRDDRRYDDRRDDRRDDDFDRRRRY
ncbi:hypothetical protein HK099_008005 [Clydaea vesicula]|uniref:RRM domain-containing protein n=1 Tax=Clydaea vesicula TaxID=447962 RepID=A0AAD5TYB2_9FUNG|nr:hypothetical protein HK099_008005 [Clydaea vesicula]